MQRCAPYGWLVRNPSPCWMSCWATGPMPVSTLSQSTTRSSSRWPGPSRGPIQSRACVSGHSSTRARSACASCLDPRCVHLRVLWGWRDCVSRVLAQRVGARRRRVCKCRWRITAFALLIPGSCVRLTVGVRKFTCGLWTTLTRCTVYWILAWTG